MKMKNLMQRFSVLLLILVSVLLVSCSSQKEDKQVIDDNSSSESDSLDYEDDDSYGSETSEAQNGNDETDVYDNTNNTLSEMLRNGCIVFDTGGEIDKEARITNVYVFNGNTVTSYLLYRSLPSMLEDVDVKFTLGEASRMNDSEIIEYLEENVPEYYEEYGWTGDPEDLKPGTQLETLQVNCKETSEYRLFLDSDSSGNNVDREYIIFGDDHNASIQFEPDESRTGTVYESFYCGYNWFNIIRTPDGSPFYLDEIGTEGIPVDVDPYNSDLSSYFGDD